MFVVRGGTGDVLFSVCTFLICLWVSDYLKCISVCQATSQTRSLEAVFQSIKPYLKSDHLRPYFCQSSLISRPLKAVFQFIKPYPSPRPLKVVFQSIKPHHSPRPRRISVYQAVSQSPTTRGRISVYQVVSPSTKKNPKKLEAVF